MSSPLWKISDNWMDTYLLGLLKENKEQGQIKYLKKLTDEILMAKACNLICNWDSIYNPSMQDHELKSSLGLYSKMKEGRKRENEVGDVEGSEEG